MAAAKLGFRLEISTRFNGRLGGPAEIIVVDDDGRVLMTDRANLVDAVQLRRVAQRIAEQLSTDDCKIDPKKVAAALREEWNKKATEHRRYKKQAQAGSPEAAPIVETKLLDAAPRAISRPLRLIEGRAYAAAWAHVQQEIHRSVDDHGQVTEHKPPLVRIENRLLVIRDDGILFTDGSAPVPNAEQLAGLGLTVALPAPLPPGAGWSGAGVKRDLAGERPGPADVFERVAAVVDRFIDFGRSLGEQRVMCELVACYILSTYLLDAFHIAGYLWINGHRGAGKTSLLQVIADTAYLGQLLLAGGSYACLRDLADYGATLCFDDAEAVMDARADPDKKALLLAGNRRGVTVPVKEALGNGAWRTRHVSAFCVRSFSAIRTPDAVLGSRSILLPLVRSGDPRRSKASVADHASWPSDRGRLVDDLWALGLTHLSRLPACDQAAAAQARLLGRDLEPWRGILAVAWWLEKQHGARGLYQRLEGLSVSYQEERGDYESGDLLRLLIRALWDLLGELGGDELTFTPAQAAQRINALAVEEDLATAKETEEGRGFTSARKLGWALRKERFDKKGRDKKAKLWTVRRGELESMARAQGVELEGAAEGSSDRETI